jgi:pimeloyl-ACP methyl ester carboxylesterase
MGEGPTLLILHGLYGTGDNWYNIARALSSSFTVYLIDQRNHGRSAHNVIHNYTEMASDVEEFVEKLNLKKINIIGHSMGGKTAMTYTLQHGENVNKLINVDISPYSYQDLNHFKEQQDFHYSIIERFLTAPISTAKSRAEVEAYFAEKITNKDTRLFLLKNLSRNKKGHFSWKLNVKTLSESLLNVIDAAPPIKMGAQSYVDTLFIRGGKSPYISDEDIESIPDIFPNSKFITYPNSGHWLHAEEPDRFIADAQAFLN